MNNQRFQKIMKMVRIATLRYQRKAAKVKAYTAPPGIGDSYLIPPLPDEIATHWLLIAQHPDQPDLFFALPADDITCLVGIWDIRCGKQVARGHFGTWLAVQTLHEAKAIRIDFGQHHFAKLCRKAMAKLVRCQSRRVTSEQACTEHDPEYEDLLQLVGKGVYLIEQAYKL